MPSTAHKATPFIWYDSQAEDAARLYVSLVPNSRIVETTHWKSGSPYPAGSVMSVTFELDGQQYIAVSISGPGFAGELIAFRLPKEAAPTGGR